MKKTRNLLVVLCLLVLVSMSSTGCYYRSHHNMSIGERREFEADMDQFSDEITDWAETFSEDMSELGQTLEADWDVDIRTDVDLEHHYQRDDYDMHFVGSMVEFGEDMGNWGESFGHEMADWGTDFGRDMADFGLDIADIFTD